MSGVVVAPTRKRLKWEPAALMILLLGMGFWIALGPQSKPKLDRRAGAVTQELRLGDTRGELEALKGPDGAFTFRVLIADAPPSEVMSQAQAERVFSQPVIAKVVANRQNWIFSLLHVTSWVGVVWVGIGYLGQLAFSGRMLLQWVVSEKKRQSVIGESFWWFSLFGGVTLFSYCVWRQDPVTMLGQALGIVVYARNLRLIYKQKRRVRRDAAASVAPVTTPSTPADSDSQSTQA